MKQRPEKNCSIMMESKGHTITTGNMKESKPADLKAGQELTILTDQGIEGDATKITTSYKDICETVNLGQTIAVSLENSATDFARMEVIDIMENISAVRVIVKEGGRIGDKETMKLPGTSLKLPALEDKDITFLNDFGIKYGVDMFVVSLTRKRDEIDAVREMLDRSEALVDKKSLQIFAKIENLEGLNNYEEILAAADGIVISRNDIEQEISSDKMFLAQKWMIERSNLAAKPVICMG